MNIIDERNVRTIHRKLKKKEYDDIMNLSASESKQTVRLLDEGMVVDINGRPLFYLMKGTLQKYVDALPDDYVGSINLGHMDFATFPFLIGEWTKRDLHLVDIGDGRMALDVDLRLDEDSVLVKELRRMPYTLGVSAEFTFHTNEEMSEKYGLEIMDEIFVSDFAIVGDAGNVNSSGIQLKGGNGMTVKELTAAIDAEQVTDLDTLNKKMEALMEGDAEQEAAEPEQEAEVEGEESVEEPAEETEAPATEEPSGEEAPAAEEAAVEEPAKEEAVEEGALDKIAEALAAIQAENAELKAELDSVKEQLAAKVKAESEFVGKFKQLTASLSTERVATIHADESADNVFTDGIGEI